jgi:hypothetical protein
VPGYRGEMAASFVFATARFKPAVAVEIRGYDAR